MPRIERTEEEKASPEQVWALMCDAKRFPEWVEFVDRMVEVPDGAMETGFTWRTYGGIAPFKSEIQWRVTESDAPRRQVRMGENSQTQITFTMELTAAGDRTRVRAQMDFQPRGVMVPMSKIMWPLLMRGRAQRAMEGTLANAKRILEVESG